MKTFKNRNKQCDNCYKMYARLWKDNSHFYCFKCYRTEKKIGFWGSSPVSKTKAFEKEYFVKPHFNKKGDEMSGYCSFPACLIGYKIKLIAPNKLKR